MEKCTKTLISDVSKDATQKRSTYLERAEKSYETTPMFLEYQNLMAKLPALKQRKKWKTKYLPK